MSDGRPDPFDTWRREQYGDAGPVLYLNNASWGPSPRASAEAVADFALRRARPGAIGDAEFGDIFRRARSAVAALLDVDADEIALAPNTGYGINLAAALVRAGPKGRIVVSAGEFPTNVLPWLPLADEGFEIEVVPTVDRLPDESALLEAIARPGTVAFSVSAVQFATGWVADLAALGAQCRQSGVRFVVDAIQGLGAIPIRPREVGADVVSGGGQKWMCSPWGSGFVWVDRRLHDRVTPPMVSWLGVRGGSSFGASDNYALEWLDDARRFEPATLGVQDHLGLAVSAELLHGLGDVRIAERLRALHEPVIAWADARADVRVVTPREPSRRAGILSLEVPDPEGTLARLAAAGVRAVTREGLLRLSPHVWVGPDRMQDAVEALDRAVDAAG